MKVLPVIPVGIGRDTVTLDLFKRSVKKKNLLLTFKLVSCRCSVLNLRVQRHIYGAGTRVVWMLHPISPNINIFVQLKHDILQHIDGSNSSCVFIPCYSITTVSKTSASAGAVFVMAMHRCVPGGVTRTTPTG